MLYAFYKDPDYRKKQSIITHESWLKGQHNSLIKTLVIRKCINNKCNNTFKVKLSDPKKFCSSHCAVSVNNIGRIRSLASREKISKWMQLHPTAIKGPRVSLNCQNSNCKKKFLVLPYMAKIRKFCCNRCAINVIGRLTTSPKASKGKPGIRIDIDPKICFYSTWEANFARVLNLLNIKWEYAPKIFDLGEHTYRPDFYLPEKKLFIEIKNFMGIYSFNRDQLFRQKYPNIKLDVILKPEYKEIEKQYKTLIDSWE